MRFRQAFLQRLVFPPIHSATRNIQSTTSLSIRQNPKEFPIGNDFSYEEVVKNFKWEVPEYFNFSRDVIDKFAETDGDRIALWFTSKEPDNELKLSFQQLSVASQKAANAIASLEVKKAVCILPKVPDWWLLNLATIRANVVLLPGTTQLQEKDIEGRLVSSKADCIIADPETAWKVDQLDKSLFSLKAKIIVGGKRDGWLSWDQLYESSESIHEAANTHKDDIMQIYFTSGTTGKPKMVPHTHSSYGYCHYPMGKYWLDLTKEDIMWNISDTGWAKSAWSTVFGPWSQGSTVFIHGMPRFTTTEVLDTLAEYPVSVLCAPPTLYRSLVQEDVKKWKLMNLRHCVSAGEPLNEEVIYNWEEATGLVIKEGYGQTETTLLLGTFKKMSKWVKPGSIGKVAPGYDVRIVNNMGKEIPRGEQGNIGVRCKPEMPPGLFKPLWSSQSRALLLSQGYCEDAQATANSFCGDFYLTGDRGVQDEDGYFWFFSRVDDLIISSGYRIGPFEVESALIEHEAVLESAVVPSPDVERGQVVKAFIVLSEKYKNVKGDELKEKELIEELQTHVKSTTAPYKYPRKIEFVTSLPKTVSGKIRRTELRVKETKQGKNM
eukprot:GFUD01093221.1.p1 GENE.GFUD01093221.1~~GFUD01093221.1.p1  ORF type:complete len:605 (-),score=142.61 GFUD01093221.1:28-1842(-)